MESLRVNEAVFQLLTNAAERAGLDLDSFLERIAEQEYEQQQIDSARG